eukprot:Gb_17544 [translate_table: standard]
MHGHLRPRQPFSSFVRHSPPGVGGHASPLPRVVISELGSYRCSGKNEMPASAVHKPEKSIVNMNNGRLQNAAMSDVSSPRIGINEASGKGSAIAATLASINGSRVHTTPKEQDVAAKEEVAGSSLIPTTKQMVDYFRQGRLIEGGVGYRQTLVVRSYEVGADKTTTIDTFLNLFQETALNHVWMSGLLGDGFGATHGMISNNLIWVVSRMQVQVENYPIWGEVVEIDTWVGASGKNGMRRDWLIRNNKSGQIFARATSTWVMMNQHTRRLSKMPDVVRAEISPWFITRCAIVDDSNEKIVKLDDSAQYIRSDLKPRRSDLDMNNHVNNVKYVGWMLETAPEWVLESHELCCITLEYRRECGRSDVVQSLCQPEDSTENISVTFPYSGTDSPHALASELLETNGLLGLQSRLRYSHLLRMQGETKNEEIVRGRTVWRRKSSVPADQFVCSDHHH